MSAMYEYGAVVTLTFLVVDGNDDPAAATVALTITAPDGTTTTPTVTTAVLGTYTSSFTPTQRGAHTYLWAATGAVVDSDTDTFDVGTGYVTLAKLKTSLGIPDTDDDDALRDAILDASREIDEITSTHFYPVTEARTFYATNSGEVDVDRFTLLTDLVVKTGTGGTYATTITAANVLPHPLNATSQLGGAYNRLYLPLGGLLSGAWPGVEVTASWGWHFIPRQVERACLIRAAALYRRKDSPEGIAGNSEFGVVRVSRFADPDVERLLRPFLPVLV